MIKRINKTRSIRDELKKDGKNYFLDQPHHLKAINQMNEQLELVKREYQIKDRNSQMNAANVILNS